jgi:ribosomal protein L24E
MPLRRATLAAAALAAVAVVVSVPAPASAALESLDAQFPATAVGRESLPVRIEIRNGGPGPVELHDIRLSTNSTDLAFDIDIESGTCLTDDGVSLVTIAPRDYCWFDAYFAPTTSGTHTATVIVATDQGGHHSWWSGRGFASPPSGYRMADAGGAVYSFGDMPKVADPPWRPATVDIESTPSGTGYWLLDPQGRVVNADAKDFRNGAMRIDLGEQATSLSSTPTGNGYWTFTDKGRVLTSGQALHFGDMSGTRLNGPVLDSVPTPTGRGYYMVASDGGIFTFGDAVFKGSMGDKKLNAPVQSLVPDGDGSGYWLVASDGGIFAFDAPFYGSMGNVKLNKPITGMVRSGDGYLMVAEDGGIFTFGNAVFRGSLGDKPPAKPIVAVTPLLR